MNNQIELDLIEKCEFEVRCINCGKIVMYANPTNFEGQQLPDMICLECKNK
jgi:hypothetical protein